jgi:hypothetical protein
MKKSPGLNFDQCCQRHAARKKVAVAPAKKKELRAIGKRRFPRLSGKPSARAMTPAQYGNFPV